MSARRCTSVRDAMAAPVVRRASATATLRTEHHLRSRLVDALSDASNGDDETSLGVAALTAYIIRRILGLDPRALGHHQSWSFS